MRSVSSAIAVRKMMGRFVVLRRWRQTERPSSPGIMISSTTRSGALRSRSRRNAAPFSATLTR